MRDIDNQLVNILTSVGGLLLVHYRLKSLSLATLLLSLSLPVVVAESKPRKIIVPTPLTAQAQTTKERLFEALRLIEVGMQAENKGQFQEALKMYQQALAIFEEVGEKDSQGMTLVGIGVVHMKLGQYPQALEKYQQALTIFQHAGKKNKKGLALTYIGLIYRKLGDYPQALSFYQKALAIQKEIDDKKGQGTTLNNIGLVYSLQGQYKKALEFYQQALMIRKQTNDKDGEANTIGNIGENYSHLGQYDKSLEFYNQALLIAREIGDKIREGDMLNGIGIVYDNTGKHTQSLNIYQQALVLRQQYGSKEEQAETIGNIGLVYSNLGQYAKSLEFHQQALAISQQIGDPEGESISFNSIGGLYYNFGQYSKALSFYQRALAISKKNGDILTQGIALGNIGLAYSSLNKYDQAIKYYQEALAIAKEIGDKSGEATRLNKIGLIYNKQEQYVKAIEYYQQALAIAKEIGEQTQEAITLNNIGLVYGKQKQYSQTLKLLQEALVIIRGNSNKAEEGTIRNNIGAVYNALNQYVNAEQTLFVAIDILESLRPGLTDNDKVSIFEKQASSYRFLQTALIAQNRTKTALEISERGRARAFIELLASKIAENTDEKKQTIKPPTLEQIKQIAKVQKSTLVEYSVNDLKLYIWVVKPTGEIAFKQQDLKLLNKSLPDFVNQSRQAIGVRSPSIETVLTPDSAETKIRLKQLHQLLIKPIADLLPIKESDKVIFIPQSSLFLVPFPALQDENGKYLIEQHTILTSPSIQVLDLTHQQRKSLGNSRLIASFQKQDAVVVGNPTMPKVSPKIGEPPQQLLPLPSAEEEAKAIAPILKTQAITGDKATKSAILQLLPKARIIHLATHGLLDDIRGLGSAIALAPSDKDDGLLTAEEIFDRVKLKAELVVLSACDTGRGRITGDGIIGLSRSLISAGTPSVIVSLWSVPDAPTAELMTEFYQNLQENPDKGVALRNAMLATMKQHPDPKNWAAFTLIGESD